MGDALARVVAEKKSPKADLIVGLSAEQLQMAISEDVLEKYRPVNSKNIVLQEPCQRLWYKSTITERLHEYITLKKLKPQNPSKTCSIPNTKVG